MNQIENILIYSLFAILTLVVGFFIFKKFKQLSLKAFLNILLILSLLPLIFSFEFQRPNSKAMLVFDDKTERKSLQILKDSLKIDDAISLNEYRNLQRFNSKDLPSNIVLFGSNFEVQDVASLAGRQLAYIPDYKTDSLKELRWRGILAPYQNQEIVGQLYCEKPSWVKARYGNITLDSVKVNGIADFALQFAGFGTGRVEVDLYLEDKFLYSCKFFVQKPKSLQVLVLNQTADFESKILSEWLAKQGHKVLIKNAIAKDAMQQLVLNAPKGNDFDLVICPPSQLYHSEVKKALKNQKSLLINGVKKSDQTLINKVFNLNLQFQSTGTGEETELLPGLYVNPVKILQNYRVNQNSKYPIYYLSPHTVVSFISESYPLMLSGDSIPYGAIWKNALAYLYHDTQDKFELNQPVLTNKYIDYQVNTIRKINNVNINSLKPNHYLIKDFAAKAGWKTINDSTEVFVSNPEASWLRIAQIQNWVEEYGTENNSSTTRIKTQAISNTLKWLMPFLIMVLLWVEPKWRS